MAALHERDIRVICYLSAGSWEPYRPDSAGFPADLLGGPVAGWPDERWLDIRRLDTLRPLMAARLDLCRDKGFDGVEPDWLDSHTQDTGFPITVADQLRYNRMLADMAHERGLAIGLKNDLGQADELADLFDFSVVEQCAEFDECRLSNRFSIGASRCFTPSTTWRATNSARWRSGLGCRRFARGLSWTPGARPVEAGTGRLVS